MEPLYRLQNYISYFYLDYIIQILKVIKSLKETKKYIKRKVVILLQIVLLKTKIQEIESRTPNITLFYNSF